MTLREIRVMPQTIEAGETKIHESVVRTYHVLNKVMELVQKNVPSDVIVELWEDMMSECHTRKI